MTRSRRWFYGLLGMTLLATAFPVAAHAQTAEPPAGSEVAVDIADRLQTVKDRVGAQIDKRLSTLERLTARVESAEHLTVAHRASLLADFAAAEAVLTEGSDAVSAATNPEELGQIVRPIFENTLVFALLVPKTHAVIASDVIGVITDRHGEVAVELQAALNRLADSGIDVAEPQANLDEAIRVVTELAAIAVPVAESVVNLQPGDEITEPLTEAGAALRGTRGELRHARRLTQQVASFIRTHSPAPFQES